MHEGTEISANLTVGDSEQGEVISNHSSLAAEASIHEEPGAGKSHAGICAGGCRVTGSPTAINSSLMPTTEILAFFQQLREVF